VPEGQSLQLNGNGSSYADFTWQNPAANTMGALNNGQTFSTVTNTVVSFASTSASVGEGDGSYDLHVTITNPDANNATSVDVVLISGDPADIGNYTTQTVTFPAGSSDDQIVVITITDDSDVEGDEVVTFELQNVTGGNNAAIGSPSQFDLTILENDFADTPDIVINEIMQNPDVVADDKGEWYELYNAGDTEVDINGWIMKDNGTNIDTIQNGAPLVIQPGGYLVLGKNGDTSVNGGVNVDYVYDNFNLGNSSDEIILYLSDGISVVDRVEWDNGSTFPDPTGKSMELINPAFDNNDGNNWAEALTIYGDGDYGTPGAQNSQFVSEITADNSSVLRGFALYSNYPNPFNPRTTIRFEIKKSSKVELNIYNTQGQKVAVLLADKLVAGSYHIEWNAINFGTGVYFATLKADGFSQTIKMVLIK
ncbi:MAG TPA: T9SS type A sorting domain-containing protein, partial [Calditrichaeota bacterium]|nr:T9SS type A sorting domain-containing protein [Calditrichota bacterium]